MVFELSPLSPVDSPSYPFAPESSASASVQSDHTYSPSLAFLFDQSAYLVEPKPDLPSSLYLLLPEATGPLPSPAILPVSIPIPLPAPAVNPVNPINLPANPRQNPPIPMSQPAFQMPFRGTPNAPKFSGKTPSELPRYLEDIDLLGHAAALDQAQKIKAAIRYAALDEAGVSQTLPEATANPADLDAFVAAIKKLHPGCEGANRYCRADIQYLVGDYRMKAMRSQDDLGEYTRKFTKFAAILIAN